LDFLPEQRPSLGGEELRAVQKVLEGGWLGMGPFAREFEAQLREHLGARHVAVCQTGTAALHLALVAAGVGQGDEVVVPSMTHVASVQAIALAGARPVFCEVDPRTLTIDVEDALRRMTPATKALLPVHYGGQACPLDELLEAAAEAGLLVVEDAAQAFGSTYRGRQIGSFGDVTCFSFDPVKSITCGEGGAIATDDDGIAGRVVAMRGLGMDRDSWTRHRTSRPWDYTVAGPGFRYLLSDLNAAIGLVQLERLELFRSRKVAIARAYDRAFADIPAIEPVERDLDEAFPFLYTVKVLGGRRDALSAHLVEAGIHAWVRPHPNHLQPAFGASRVELPVSERLAGQVMTLPHYVDLTDDDVARVVGEVRSFFDLGPER
jgi:dTDP-4-amino-4,6-dideoxygalactose transaminase